MPPVKGDVQKILGPYHARIRGVVERAWAEWRKIAAYRTKQEMAPIMYSRTVANYVFDAIARIAIAEFAGDASVHIKPESQTVKFFFKDGVLGRFKKGEDEKLGQCIPTQAALAFESADATLPGLPPETAKVEFIWLANDIHTRLEHVLVVARDQDSLLWEYEIDSAVPGAGAGTVILFSQPSSLPPSSGNEGLVTPKKPAPKKPQEKE